MNIDLTSLLNLDRIDINTAIMNSIEQNEVRIIDLNRVGQLDEGIGSDGQSLGKYSTIKYKGRLEPVDLKLKNDFRAQESLEINNNFVLMVDQDYKTPFLNKRYGPILGWTDENIDNMGRMIEADVIQNLETQLSV